MDTTRPRVRDSQIIHFHPGSVDGGHHAKGGQDAEGLGVEYWQNAQEERYGWEWLRLRLVERLGSQYKGVEGQA